MRLHCRVPLLACALGLTLAAGCFEDPQANASGGGGDEGDDTTAGDEEDGSDDASDSSDSSDDAEDSSTGESSESSTETSEESSEETSEDTGPVEQVLFDLYDLACDVQWVASGGADVNIVDCNVPDEGKGAAIQHPTHLLEDDSTGEKVLAVHSFFTADGVISGSFDNLDLSGATAPALRFALACPDFGQACDISWQAYARPAGTSDFPEDILDGFQSYDGSVTTVELDLSALLEPVDVILVVTSNDSQSVDDIGLFVYPRVVELGG